MITVKSQKLSNSDSVASYDINLLEGRVKLHCQIFVLEDHLHQYQIDLFQEVVADIIDKIQSDDTQYEEVRTTFEKSLQSLNTTLTVFAHKAKDITHFPISGHITLMYHDQLITSLIGNASALIFRHDSLIYSMSNQSLTKSKIDLFGELVEGELVDGDSLVFVGHHLDTFLDADDYQQIHAIATAQEVSYAAALIDILSVRVEPSDLNYISILEYSTGKLLSQKNLRRWMSFWSKVVAYSQDFIEKHRSKLSYVWWWLAILLLLFWSMKWFTWPSYAPVVWDDGEVLINFTIDDLQRDVGLFKQISATSNEKIKKYNEIVNKLNLLEENNKWINDVAQLRKILESEYSQWFNIELINTIDQFEPPVYEFTQKEKNVLWEIREVYKRDWFMIWWESGVLIGAINQTVRWTLVSAAIWQDLHSCGFNLLKNGLFCSANDGKMYVADNNWFQPVVLPEWTTIPRSISDIWPFTTSNMYVLTEDTRFNNQTQYIVRYKNVRGSQTNFAEALPYELDPTFIDEFPAAFGSGVSSFAIDGNFLIRSGWDKSLYQLRRDPDSGKMKWRNLELSGGDTERNALTDDVKVITDIDSRYVYLFDRIKQNFQVYRTTPYKTTPGWDKDYSLQYFFTISFDLGEWSNIVDLFVEEGEKSNLFVMTPGSIYKIPLHEKIDKYLEKMEEEG